MCPPRHIFLQDGGPIFLRHRYARKTTILYSYIADNAISAVDGVCSSASFDSKSDVKGNSLIVAIKIK